MCAQRDDLDWLWKSLSKRYTLKSKVLGPNSGEFREIEFLGRRFAWTRSGITYEADPKHVRVMLEEWCMTSCNKVASPGVKDERSEEAEVPLAGPSCPFVPAHCGSFKLLGPGQSGPGFRHQRSGSHHERSLHKRRGQIETHFALRARPSSRATTFLNGKNCQCNWWLRWTAIGQDAHELGAPLLVAHSALESTA